MDRLTKRIIATVTTAALLCVTVVAADSVNERIGVKTTNGSTKASNIVGFDTEKMVEEPKLMYRFSVTTLADNQDLADYFYSGTKAAPQRKEYGTAEWHQALSDYMTTHMVTGAGDGYWLGDHDTVDYRGHIIHCICTKEKDGKPLNQYGPALYEALEKAVTNDTQSFVKGQNQTLYSFKDDHHYKHLVLSYDTCRLFYDYVKYQYEHNIDGVTRDPYTYTMFKTLQQNIEDNDVDDPIVLVIEVQAPVLGDGEHSVRSVDNTLVYDPIYSYWATAADMVVRCGGSLDSLRNSDVHLSDDFPTDTNVYSKAINNKFAATSLTDRFTAKLTGSYVPQEDTVYDTVKPCKIYGNVWPNRWTEMFYKDSYTEWGVRLRTKGLYAGSLIYDGKINNPDDNHINIKPFDEVSQINYNDVVDSYTVATLFSDYSYDTSSRDSDIYASIDRTVYPINSTKSSSELLSDGVKTNFYYSTKSDLISTIQDDIATGTIKYTINEGQHYQSKDIDPSDLLKMLLEYKPYTSDYKVQGVTSGIDVTLKSNPGQSLGLHSTGSDKVHFNISTIDVGRSGIEYYSSTEQPATAMIGHINYDQFDKSNGTPTKEREVLSKLSTTMDTQLKTQPLKLTELINFSEPLTTAQDLTLLSGAQLFKVRMKYAYHVDNYQHKIYLHNVQYDNPAYLTVKFFDADTGSKSVKDNQMVLTLAPEFPDETLYSNERDAINSVRHELDEVNAAYSRAIASISGDPYEVLSNKATIQNTALNIYKQITTTSLNKNGISTGSTAELGKTTTIAAGDIGEIGPTEGFSGYKLTLNATQYHGDVIETETTEGTRYKISHPVISIVEGFQGTGGDGKLMTDYIARTRHKSTGDSSFCSIMRYNNVAYIELLDAKVDVLNSIDGYGILNNLALTDESTDGQISEYTQLTSDKQLVLTKAMNEFGFKYYIAAYNKDNYTRTDRTKLDQNKPNGYYLTEDIGHQELVGGDTRETNIDNSLLLNWDENIHQKVKSKIEIPDGYTSSNYLNNRATREQLRNMMYTTNLQRTGRLINSFLYPTKDSMATKTFADVDATADFSGMYLTAMKALVPSLCYVEDSSDDIHLYWDPTKFGGTDYGTLPIASALMTSIYFYRQCNFLYVMDDSLELQYNGNTFSLCGADPLNTSEINGIMDNGVVSQLLLNKYYTTSAYHVLNEFTTGSTFKPGVWHNTETDSNLKAVTAGNGYTRTATLKTGSDKHSISWIGNKTFQPQRYVYWIRRVSGHGIRYCRYNNKTENKLDLMNDTTVRFGSDLHTYNSKRGYKALMTNQHIYDNNSYVKKEDSTHIYGVPYIGYNATAHTINTMPVISSESKVFSQHGQYPFSNLNESRVTSDADTNRKDLAVEQRKLLNQLSSESAFNYKITDQSTLAIRQTEETTARNITEQLKNADNKGIYINATFPAVNAGSDVLKYITPFRNTVNIGGYDEALTAGTMNILRSNLNGSLDTGCVTASYRELINDHRKYDFYIDTLVEAPGETQYSPKLLSLDKHLRAKDASLSMFSENSEISVRDVGRTVVNNSLDSRNQASIELANINILENAEIHASTPKLSKYIGISDNAIDPALDATDYYTKKYAIRDQRVGTDLHTLDGTQYDDKLVTSYDTTDTLHGETSVTNVYADTISTSMKEMEQQAEREAAPGVTYVKTPQSSGTITVSQNEELRYVATSGVGVAFEARKGEQYYYSPHGIQRKSDTTKRITISDIINDSSEFDTDYENGIAVQTNSSVTLTPIGKDTDGIRIKLGSIYDTKNHIPRTPNITSAKYVSVVPNFSFINQNYGSDFIGYHAVQLDPGNQNQQFSFHLNNVISWKPELKDFLVIAADESNRVIGTINNQNNFIWKDLSDVEIHHILSVPMDKKYSYNPDDANSYKSHMSEYIKGSIPSGTFFPYPQIAFESGALGQTVVGDQIYYQKDMKMYDKLNGVVISEIPALDTTHYNLYRIQFKYLGVEKSVYIEQGLVTSSLNHHGQTRNFLDAYNAFTEAHLNDSLASGRLFSETPLNYLYDDDVKSSAGTGVSFRRAIKFGDLPIPYILGTDLDNDIVNPEYDDKEGQPENIEDYYNTTKTSGIPMRAGDVFEISLSISDYIRSEHGLTPIKFSFLEDSDDGYLVDNTKNWTSRNTLDKTKATVELLYDNSNTSGSDGFTRVAIFRMLRDANIQPLIQIPNSAKVVMSESTPVFTCYDTTILAENSGSSVSQVCDIIDPTLYSPNTYGTSNAQRAYEAYANGMNVSKDLHSLNVSTAYTIYNEAIADFFIVTDESINTTDRGYIMETPYVNVQKQEFDSTKKHLVDTQDVLVGTKTIHGGIIHNRRDALWNSPNARFNTKATNPADNKCRYGDDKYHTEYLIRNVRMNALHPVKTRGSRTVQYTGLGMDMLSDPIVFKSLNTVYVSPNKDFFDKNVTCNYSGSESIKNYPDLLWLYSDPMASNYKATTNDILAYPTLTNHYLDFTNNGKFRYMMQLKKSAETTYRDVFDVEINTSLYDVTKSDKYNSSLLSKSTTTNYVALPNEEVLQKNGDATMFSLDDEFTVKVDFGSLDNIKRIKYAYIKFPFPVYIREGLKDKNFAEDTDSKIVKFEANTEIPLGQYFETGLPVNSTDYDPSGDVLDLNTLSLDGMHCYLMSEVDPSSARTEKDAVYYLTDETRHFAPYQYVKGTTNFEYTYHFWIPLTAGEWCNTRYEIHAIPYNNPSIATQTFGSKVNYLPNSHSRNTLGYKNSIDIVGRIGAFTLNDIADFRWSDTFKKETDGWYAYGLIHKVSTDPKIIVTEPYDIRGIYFNVNENYEIESHTDSLSMNTYGKQPHRGSDVKMYKTPLQTSFNVHEGLKRSFPLNGYSQYYSIETTGNYYGQSQQPIDIVDNMKTGVNSVNPNNEFGQEKIQIIPVYYDIAIDDRGRYRIYPLDAYQMTRNGSYKLINRNLYYKRDYEKVLQLIDANSYYIYESNNTSDLKHEQDYVQETVTKYISDNLKRKNIMDIEAYTAKRVTTHVNNFLNKVATKLQLIIGKSSNMENTTLRTKPIPGSDLAALVAGSARLYQIESIIDNFGATTGSTSLLLGDRYIQGTAQASFLRGRARTFIGGPSNALSNEEMEDVFLDVNNVDIQTLMNAQKHYYTQQIPSDIKYVYSDYIYKVGDKQEDIFLPNEETLTYKDAGGNPQTVNIRHYILTRFNIIANGSVWSLRYNVPTNGQDTVYILDRAKTDKEKEDVGFDDNAKLPIYVDIDNPDNYFNNGSIRFFSGDKERAHLYDPPASGFGSIPQNSSEETNVATNLYKDPSGATIDRSNIATTDKASTTETLSEKTDPSSHTNTTRDFQGPKADNSSSNDPKDYGSNDDPPESSNGKAKDPSGVNPERGTKPTTDGILSQDPPGSPMLPNNSNLDDLSTSGTH